MRVLVCNRPGGAFGYISDGWMNALGNRGHQTIRWDGQQSSWDAFAPDLYIGCSGHKQPIPLRRGKTKVAIHVNPYGPSKIKDISESDQNISWTVAQRPDAVFGYGHETDKLLWSYWTEREGIPWAPMPTAGDATLYHDHYAAEESKKYDVVYLGGRWAYKGKSIDKFLLPVLRDRRMTNSVCGWGEWPDDMAVQPLPDMATCRFLASGRVAPCISEPHTQQYGFDVPERMFKAALCGTLVVHDPVPDLKRHMQSAVVSQNPDNFLDLCMHYSNPAHAEERLELSRSQRREVMSGQTYHHRLRVLLGVLGFRDASEGMVDE